MKLILCGDIVPTEYTTATFDRQDCAEQMGACSTSARSVTIPPAMTGRPSRSRSARIALGTSPGST